MTQQSVSLTDMSVPSVSSFSSSLSLSSSSTLSQSPSPSISSSNTEMRYRRDQLVRLPDGEIGLLVGNEDINASSHYLHENNHGSETIPRLEDVINEYMQCAQECRDDRAKLSCPLIMGLPKCEYDRVPFDGRKWFESQSMFAPNEGDIHNRYRA